MKAKSILILAIGLLISHPVSVLFAGKPSFQGIGNLQGTSDGRMAVSADGLTAVGYRQLGSDSYEAFYWTVSSGIIGLGYLPGGNLSTAAGISADGSVVVGYSRSSLGGQAFRWTEAEGMVGLHDLPGGKFYSTAYDVSADGSVVVGFSSSEMGVDYEAFLWTESNGMIGLGGLSGGWYESQAYAVSADGLVVVGYGKSASGEQAFRWTESEGILGLGYLSGGLSRAYGISPDGSVVVGRANRVEGAVAFRWTDSEGMVSLGDLPGGSVSGTAYDASTNGSIIVGSSNSFNDFEAFIWDEDNGIRSLQDLLINNYHLDLAGWHLRCAYGVSDDGTVIVGSGNNPQGQREGWIAVLTELEPAIIYVDDDATGANDGSSWADAFNYLQDALTAAWSGDEIHVAQGIYKPDRGAVVTTGDREATFQLINGVTLNGSYAGTSEPDPNARDIKEYRTFLSGDLAGDDRYNFANRKENSYHIVTGSGTDATAVLDGFYIWRGHANRQEDPWGAGMYNDHGSPTVKNCAFVSNHAFAEHGSMGGGMYNYGSSPVLINCRFSGNSADVTDKNKAGGNGAGMYNHLSSPKLTNCTFMSNDARDYGGGIYNIDSNLTLIYSTLQANRAFLDGGGIYNCRSTLTLTKCMLVENWVYGSNNGSNNGGAMYSTASDITLTICTLARNGATNGSSLACDSPGQLHPSSVQMTNCIFWDYGNEIWNNDNSSVIISYSDVRCGWPGEGNISADPLFVPAGGNLRLSELSPCIDTGDPNYISEPNETDFDGFPRIVGGRIDMGVYEFQGRLILYVDNDAPGSNDGSSWANAYNCLQDALIPADPTGGPVEIRVAEGIYKPDQGAAVTPGDRRASFRIKPRVTVKGGYAGFGEPDPNVRYIKFHESILSGDLAGDDGPNFENYDENSYNVVRGGALGETTILDGFTITGGNAYGPEVYHTEGGGIHVFPDINFTIKNCTIIRNRAKYHGGGIHSLGSSGCCFPIINCRFISNSAGWRGGAISLDGESMPRISNCIFAGNSAESGGAIGNIEGYPRIKNCTFTGNRAQDECDAVGERGRFRNCILWANTGQSPQPIPDCYGGYYSCIQGWTGALGGIGNINEDPLFVEPGYWNANGTPDDANDDVWVDGDYHLLPGSPCIDSGDPNYIAGPNETDLDGGPRIIGGRIDMGAYETPIFAEIRILPRTINLASKGKWITCYIWLPDDYDVADIESGSVLLERQIKAEQLVVNEQEQVAIARFDREKVRSILNVGEIELTITCQLTDGTVFEATDIIKVTDKAGKKSVK